MHEHDSDQARGFRVATAVAALGTGLLVRRGLARQWTKRTGKQPPANPAAPEVEWREAVAWAAVSGIAAGVAGVVARRLVSSVWPTSA